MNLQPLRLVALLLLVCSACRPKQTPSIVGLHPASTRAGVGFNLQPDGRSAIAVDCRNATRSTYVVIDDQKLKTTAGSPTSVSAIMPDEYFAKAGQHEIRLADRDMESKPALFTVLRATGDDVSAAEPVARVARPTNVTAAAAGVVPKIVHIFPAIARAHVGFNVQPDGTSAMAVRCENGTNTTVIEIDDVPLKTSFGSATDISALVPPTMFARPGSHSVKLVDRGGESGTVEFRVVE